MASSKRLVFSEGHFAATLDGTKKISLRFYRAGSHDFTVGDVFYGEFKPEGVAFLLRATHDTEFVLAGEIPDHIAREDGYEDGEHAFHQLQGYYSQLDPYSRMAIIRYEILAHVGDPVIKYLPGA